MNYTYKKRRLLQLPGSCLAESTSIALIIHGMDQECQIQVQCLFPGTLEALLFAPWDVTRDPAQAYRCRRQLDIPESASFKPIPSELQPIGETPGSSVNVMDFEEAWKPRSNRMCAQINWQANFRRHKRLFTSGMETSYMLIRLLMESPETFSWTPRSIS